MSQSRPGRARRRFLVTLLIATLVSGQAAVSSFAAVDVIVRCQAALTVSIVPDATTTAATWTLGGIGTCARALSPSHFVGVAGTGSSFDLGPCTSPDRLLMQALDIKVTMTLTNIRTSRTRVIVERWTANETTFPIATPFEVVRNNADVGVGVLFSHLGGQCPPDGSPAGRVFWIQDI